MTWLPSRWPLRFWSLRDLGGTDWGQRPHRRLCLKHGVHGQSEPKKKNISWRYGSHGPFSSMIHHDLLNLNIVVFHSYVELPGGKWPSYFDVSGVEDKTIWCLWNHVESKWDLGFGIDASESMPGSWVFKHIGSVSLKLSSPNYLDGFSKRPLILKQVLWSAPNLASSAP